MKYTKSIITAGLMAAAVLLTANADADDDDAAEQQKREQLSWEKAVDEARDNDGKLPPRGPQPINIQDAIKQLLGE